MRAVAGPAITKQPQSQTVAAGTPARFEVVADGATSWEWADESGPIAGAASAAYVVTATAARSGSKYRVTVKNAAGEARISDWATLTVAAEVPVVYEPRFAAIAAAVVLGTFLVVLWPVWAIAGRVSFGKDVSFPAVIAVQLVIVGVLIALAGIYLSLLEFRGRARTVAELRPPAGPESAVGGLGAVDEVAKSIPEALKAFGQLKAPAAAMAIAALLFICATVISWRGLPATSTTGPTTTAVAPATTTSRP